jgi:predicted  nucleic acid-binding Zn-ribbon protein
MEFETLLQQLGELEKLNRDEERKLIEETQRHETTKRELDKVLAELKVQKEKEVLLLEKLTTCQTEKENDAKTIKQLKEALKNSKKENELLREKMEKEVAITKEKRVYFVKKMEAVNNELKRLKQLYFQRNIKVEELTSPPAEETADNTCPNQNEGRPLDEVSEKEMHCPIAQKNIGEELDQTTKTIQLLEEKVASLEKEKESLLKKYEGLVNERAIAQHQENVVGYETMRTFTLQ